MLHLQCVGDDGRMYLWMALGVGVLALVAALMLARAVIASDTGTAEMQAISNAIREGAEAFLRRQYRTIGAIAVVLAVVVFCGVPHVGHGRRRMRLKTVISFLVGAVCSGLAGYTGMYCSIRANIRTASAARTSLNKALQMALRGGAVTGLVVVALSLLGVGSLFLFFGGLGASAGGAVPVGRVWVWSFAGGVVCAAWRRNLYQGRGCGRGPGGQGRGGNS